MDILLDFVKCFIVGGFICFIGQLLLNYTKLTSGRILVIFLISGVILQALGVYQHIVDFAGSGATVPISGFGYLLAKGAMEGASQGLLEAVTGGVKAAAGGISIAIGWGYIIALLFDPKSIR